MHTPSLRRRVTATSACVLVVLLLGMDAFLYLTLRAQLAETLDQVLDTRIGVAVRLSTQVPTSQLATALTEVGVPATVRGADGREFVASPAVPHIGQYTPPTLVFEPRVERTAGLTRGGTVTVYASEAGVQQTLQRLLGLELLGTAAAVVLAVVLLDHAARRALTPLGQVVATAERTAAGTTGLRLRPDRPHTELGQMALAYDRMLDALEAALNETRRSDERTQRFLADAAHQLRTPITRIRTSVESLFRTDDPAARDRLLISLVRETGRARRLLSSLLQIARLDQGAPPARSPVDIGELCRLELDRVEPFAPHLRFELRLCDPPLPPVDIDGEGLREALSNLLDNARRHAVHAVIVEVGAVDDAVRVAVVDDGPGVDVNDRERIFERFASLDDKGGSGLGLPVARGVARAHGGDLVYTGRAFELTLPRRTAGIAAWAPEPSGREHGEHLRKPPQVIARNNGIGFVNEASEVEPGRGHHHQRPA
jgi:two-component system OmpR family sensor kinase